ncbi:MAG: Fur family transcriptional regulator [Gammaproteobacteria bacterium]|nr:Fur family transcriptional regulator [Gammaproteobacteria bacterium]
MLDQSDKFPLSREDVAALLRTRGISPTQQRIEIAQLLLERPQHLSAEQILVLVNKERPLASKATVYNTLRVFAEQGLINEVIVDPTRMLYDSNVDPHHHFYNLDTGTLMDVGADQLALSALPALPEGTVTAGIEVIIRVRNAPGSQADATQHD